ncbi:MAG: cytochrome d ubiquinol oxidase subunit II [Desulfobacterales bacterium]|nr:cytochrome d ubiquinol oxidase subunit II [Desulfobacterales bacterium]MDJ0912365.1 cytochrome d ubiquinol oxidase subunit II [Desulfobacterales bacterium]
MFSLENLVDLPMIWFVVIATAIFLYILLDGFDLGVGILFPFAPTDQCRDRMMNSIAPFWDGNETWLILGGGGLLAAFPLAFVIIMPALYIPIIVMFLGLIFRGVAFEFRFKATGKARRIWDASFHFGSFVAAFMQGVVIGAVVQGIEVEGRSYAGGAFDWLNAYSIMTGFGVVFGYVLLGATWLVVKTDGETQAWARKSATYAIGFVAAFLAIVSISMPIMNADIRTLWFSMPNFLFLVPLPTASLIMLIIIWRDLHAEREIRPFLLSFGVFLTGYIGIGISMWPYVVPFQITYRQAAAAPEAQSLMLVGTIILLPVILGYTGYCYYTFRGKASHEHESAY